MNFIQQHQTHGRKPDSRRASGIRRHRPSACRVTGLDRYRDRHQARHAAAAAPREGAGLQLAPFACIDCSGFHLAPKPSAPRRSCEQTSFPPERHRRYALVDVENITEGARRTASELAALWTSWQQGEARFSADDHVVVGAAWPVAMKYRHVFDEANVRWVIGSRGPDGADRALLAAIDLRHVARNFDELVILSGDHAFAKLASEARAMGLTVHVIAGNRTRTRSALARELARAADRTTALRMPEQVAVDTEQTVGLDAARFLKRIHQASIAA